MGAKKLGVLSHRWDICFTPHQGLGNKQKSGKKEFNNWLMKKRAVKCGLLSWHECCTDQFATLLLTYTQSAYYRTHQNFSPNLGGDPKAPPLVKKLLTVDGY